MAFRMEVTGMDELLRKMEKLGEKGKAAASMALYEGARVTADAVGQAVNGIAIMIVVVVFLTRFVPGMNALLTEKRLQDLGNFLMAFMLFWAYLSISQLMIIWSNNTVETSGYYVDRITGAWEPVAIAITVIGFFAPFVILFSRWVKRKRLVLALVALWAIAVRMLDVYWIIIPSFARDMPEFRWLDIILLLGMGGLWVGYFLHRLASRPILTSNDPRLKEAAGGH